MNVVDQFIATLDALQKRMQEEKDFGEKVIAKRAAMGNIGTEEAMQTPEGRILVLQSERVIANVNRLFEYAFEACDAAEEGGVDPGIVQQIRNDLHMARQQK